MFVGPLLLLAMARALRKIFLSKDAEAFAIAGTPVLAAEGDPDG